MQQQKQQQLQSMQLTPPPKAVRAARGLSDAHANGDCPLDAGAPNWSNFPFHSHASGSLNAFHNGAAETNHSELPDKLTLSPNAEHVAPSAGTSGFEGLSSSIATTSSHVDAVPSGRIFNGPSLHNLLQPSRRSNDPICSPGRVFQKPNASCEAAGGECRELKFPNETGHTNSSLNAVGTGPSPNQYRRICINSGGPASLQSSEAHSMTTSFSAAADSSDPVKLHAFLQKLQGLLNDKDYGPGLVDALELQKKYGVFSGAVQLFCFVLQLLLLSRLKPSPPLTST